MSTLRWFCLLLLSFLTVACIAPATTSTKAPTQDETITPVILWTPDPTSTPLIPTLTTTTTPTIESPILTHLPPVSICSPLEGVKLSELIEVVSNPFNPPRIGYDNGHQGTDFSFYRFNEWVGIQGMPVDAVLAGKVAAVILNRMPYGNMILIETAINDLPTIEILPTPVPTVMPPNLSCPSLDFWLILPSEPRSLYILYAHLNKAPLAGVGETVTCGQQLGEVGTTGNSVNPHLHMEMRIGPAGARFESMAHYTGDATISEMANYCMWRASGRFQMVDPLTYLIR
jgi:murein DD-endopeptidase MepM/ murein hydrolase activator NlpD